MPSCGDAGSTWSGGGDPGDAGERCAAASADEPSMGDELRFNMGRLAFQGGSADRGRWSSSITVRSAHRRDLDQVKP